MAIYFEYEPIRRGLVNRFSSADAKAGRADDRKSADGGSCRAFMTLQSTPANCRL